MANAMRKIGVYLGLVDDDPMVAQQYADQYDYEPERHAAAAPVPAATPSRLRPVPEHVSVRYDSRGYEPEASHDAAGAALAAEIAAISTIHPRTYNDARRVGEEYRNGHAVIINLTEMDDKDAKRIVDFAAGIVFGLHGSIERVTNKVFLLSPANVDLRDAPAVRQARDGFFNQS
jgi:cell division inhibitor SepF